MVMASRTYRAEDFEPSGWPSGTPEKKARFVNALVRFIAAGCPREKFTKSLYEGLYNDGYFSFVAEYDIHGFYAEHFSTRERRTQFLADLREDCEREATINRLDLWTDVKRVLAEHLRYSGQAPAPSPFDNPFGQSLRPLGATRARDNAPTLF
jgi:hypothetical protein